MSNTDFEAWNHATLARFAADATEQLKQKDEEIADLKFNLKAALNSYRQMLKKELENDNTRSTR